MNPTLSKMFAIALVGIVGIPSVAFGGSFVRSLVEGKTPEEAIAVITEQLDGLFGRVAEVETAQVSLEATTTLIVDEQKSLKEAQESLKKDQKKVVEQQKELKDLQESLKDRQTDAESVNKAIAEKQKELEAYQARLAEEQAKAAERAKALETKVEEIPEPVIPAAPLIPSRMLTVRNHPLAVESKVSRGTNHVIVAHLAVDAEGNVPTHITGIVVDHFDPGVMENVYIEAGDGTTGNPINLVNVSTNVIPINVMVYPNSSIELKVYADFPKNGPRFFAEQLIITGIKSDAGNVTGTPLWVPEVFFSE